MKKVVVVTDKGLLDGQEFFQGEDIKVINRLDATISSPTRNVLVVMDGKEDIAVFQEWQYWKKVE